MSKVLTMLRNCRPVRILAWVTLPLFPLLCLFIMDLMNFGGHPSYVLQFAENFPGALIFEVLVTTLVFIFLLLLCRLA